MLIRGSPAMRSRAIQFGGRPGSGAATGRAENLDMRTIPDPAPPGSPIRVGLLGAGGISTAHALSLKALPGAELVGVADVDPRRAKLLTDRFGGEPYDSLEALMAGARPDA